jgi:uncharacterized protein YqeY
MNLKTEIKKNITEAIIQKDEEKKNALRILLGEINRKEKNITNDQIISIIKKLIKDEKETLKYNNKTSSKFIQILEEYIPKQLSINEIVQWIDSNVDFSKLKNKMQVIGMLKKEFGEKIDGNIVRNIILNNY